MQNKHLFSKIAPRILGLSIVLAGVSISAFGAGFEKNVMWSGKWVGVAGAATSAVEGPESLFFNPAGLAGRAGFAVSGNFSPTFGDFQGPIVANDTQEDTGYRFSPVFGVLASYGLTDRLSFGIGSYVSAGTKAIYEDIAVPGNTQLTAASRAELYGLEYALGAAYELVPGLKIGAAWRIVHAQARLTSARIPAPASVVEGDFNDLGQTRYGGYRIGAQYFSPDKVWGLGVNFRSTVDFNLKGTGTVRSSLGNAAVTTTDLGESHVSASLPAQISVGGNYMIVPDTLRLLVEYVWTEYHRVQQIGIDKSFAGTSLNVGTGWRNQTNVRAGLICTAVPNYQFRAGYAWTSQVTPDEQARATLASPGNGNTVTLGAGRSFMDNMLDLDIALEHSWASGNGTSPALTGEYFSSSWAAHLGATYRL